MQVIRASVLGFCMGVRRAVDMAWAELTRNRESGVGRVYSIGPLIHNPQVIEKLKNAGLIDLEEKVGSDSVPQNLSGSVVIIRAHGISPKVEEDLLSRGASLADATCPRVKAAQLKARSLAEEGYSIFLAGEKDHAEVVGICSYAAGAGPMPAHTGIQTECLVVSNAEDARMEAERLFREAPNTRAALLGQTTMQEDIYRSIGEGIRHYFPDLKIINSLCRSAPQKAMMELCGKTDALIVAGGRSSANTRRLLGIAQDLGKPAWLVETVAELPPEIAQYLVAGLSAGASTPDEIIVEIENALLKL
ncbi:MAG: 4-hydroxy-3-methylbut-2-enyl diphosphate reductase [Treponema sp.]|jgi:4-hydroxy-3-methylbut-2-enyl diphosphate reductase|nr:4-hydroxy-3-methylbut-2-enyl diphosphate reductase [Treponema sp.]